LFMVIVAAMTGGGMTLMSVDVRFVCVVPFATAVAHASASAGQTRGRSHVYRPRFSAAACRS
jgi:hypothetical protein